MDSIRDEQYNKYLKRKMTEVDQERLSKSGRFQPTKALSIQNINHLIEKDTIDPVIGYCQFEDGGGLASAYTFMEGVTIEMINWWFIWIELDARRYKLWFPSEHVDMRPATAKDMERYLDKNLPFYQRRWNTISRPIEGIGFSVNTIKALDLVKVPLGEVDIHFKNPRDIGFKDDLLNEDLDKSIVCGFSYNTMTNFPVTMVHIMKETETGVEFHSRFWFGYKFEDGEFKRIGSNIPTIVLKKMTKHCLSEYTNLGSLLPEVYSEFKNTIE